MNLLEMQPRIKRVVVALRNTQNLCIQFSRCNAVILKTINQHRADHYEASAWQR